MALEAPSTETALQRLLRKLPEASEAAVGEDSDSRARSVLACAIDLAISLPPLAAIEPDPATCPNCGKIVTSERSPYCNEECREISGFVRSMRRGVAEGSIFDPERQASLGQVLWHLLGGGYPGRQKLVPDKARERLFKTTDGKCALCTAPATTFDHIATACNRPINLRPVCYDCTVTKQFGDPGLLAQSQAMLRKMAQRIGSPEAVRCCDDATTWDWRAYLRERAGLTLR